MGAHGWEQLEPSNTDLRRQHRTTFVVYIASSCGLGTIVTHDHLLEMKVSFESVSTTSVSLPCVLDCVKEISEQVSEPRVFFTCLAACVLGHGSTRGVVVFRTRAIIMASLVDGTSDIQVHGASLSVPFFLSLGCSAADLRGDFRIHLPCSHCLRHSLINEEIFELLQLCRDD